MKYESSACTGRKHSDLTEHETIVEAIDAAKSLTKSGWQSSFVRDLDSMEIVYAIHAWNQKP